MSFRGRGRDFNRFRDGGRERNAGRGGRDDPGQFNPAPYGFPSGGSAGYGGGDNQDSYYGAGPSRGRRDGPARGGRGRDGPGPRRDRDRGFAAQDRREPYALHNRDHDRPDRGPRKLLSQTNLTPDTDGPLRALPNPARPNPTKEVRLERLARERVSRTLFYETMSEKFRTDFERFGELREFFDSISRRGLAFVTYYDIRGAEAARREMHGTKIYGRAIDVHFGLPKEHDREGPCDQSKNQGTLLARIHPPRPLHPDEVGPVAEQSGAIKTIRDGRVPSEVMIEFYDSRAAVDFHARFANKPFGGGTLELDYMWDEGEIVNPDPVRADEVISSTFVTRRELLDREGRGHKYPQVPDQYDNKRGQSPPRRYGGGGRYNDAPTHAMRPPVQDPHRLEEARKVQNLLATLGSVPSLGSGAPPNPQGPPPPGPGYGGPPPPPGPPPDPRRSSYSGPPSGPPPGPPPRPPPMRYPPGPPPPSYSSAPPPSHSPSYPPPSSSYPLSNYPPAPPPASYPPQHSPPAPAPSYAPPYSPVASSTPLPSQVLAMLQPQQSGQQGYQSSPPAQSYDQRQAYNASPPQQGYQSTPGYGGAPDYRPPRPQPGYNSQPPQQQQGYDPKTGSDVSSLLAMLNR